MDENNLNDIYTGKIEPATNITRFRHYHWRSFVSMNTRCAQQEVIVDRIKGTVVIVGSEQGNELYRVRIRAEKKWLDEFFQIAEQFQWKKREDFPILDGSNEDVTITFSDGHKVKQYIHHDRPEVYQKLEESLRELLIQKHFPSIQFEL